MPDGCAAGTPRCVPCTDTGGEGRWDLLTERERENFQLAGEGRANKEIASRLNLSTHTVETHRKNIGGKLDLHGTTETIL